MPYIAARCPQCAGDLQLDKELKLGYCMHCDTPVYFKSDVIKVQITNVIEASNIPKLESLIMLIKKDLESGNNRTKLFKERLNRALELDPENQFLYGLQLSKIWSAEISNGVLHKYEDHVREFIVPYCITQIAKNAFSKCKGLKKITMHENVVSIGYNAFGEPISLIIYAYGNSYAASYAINNKILLFLMDGAPDIQKYVLEIHSSLCKIDAFITNGRLQIQNSFSSDKFSKRNALRVFFILAVLIILYIVSTQTMTIAPGLTKTLLSFSFVVGIGLIFIIPLLDTYTEILSTPKINKFNKFCCSVLESANIINYKYLINLWKNDTSFAKNEADKIKSITAYLLNTDINKFLN